MNEEELLIGFLKLYLDGLDKVSKYDAVRVGIEISAERLQGMAAGRVIYMHPAIPAK